MVKIGSVIINEDKLVLAHPGPSGDVVLEMEDGGDYRVEGISIEDLSYALDRLGLLAMDRPPELLRPELTPDELKELVKAERDGMRWVAKDDNGDVYAYPEKPTQHGIKWWPGADGEYQLLSQPYDGLHASDPEPLDLRQLDWQAYV